MSAVRLPPKGGLEGGLTFLFLRKERRKEKGIIFLWLVFFYGEGEGRRDAGFPAMS